MKKNLGREPQNIEVKILDEIKRFFKEIYWGDDDEKKR